MCYLSNSTFTQRTPVISFIIIDCHIKNYQNNLWFLFWKTISLNYAISFDKSKSYLDQCELLTEWFLAFWSIRVTSFSFILSVQSRLCFDSVKRREVTLVYQKGFSRGISSYQIIWKICLLEKESWQIVMKYTNRFWWVILIKLFVTISNAAWNRKLKILARNFFKTRRITNFIQN